MKIALSQLNPTVGALDHNLQKICAAIAAAKKQGATIVLFPEMALIGYPPEDLLLFPHFIDAAQTALEKLIGHTEGIAVVVGTVRRNQEGGEKGLYNTAAIIENKKLLGFQDKSLLPTYDVFSERRYFEPSRKIEVWKLQGVRVAITICEDLWQHAGAIEESSYPRDPVKELKGKEFSFLLNLSASPYAMGRKKTRLAVYQKAARTLNCPVLICNQVGANDGLIFEGGSFHIGSQGQVLACAKSFQEDLLLVDPNQTTSSQVAASSEIEELKSALVLGVKDYFVKQGFKKAVLGLSGGIDSAVVAAIAVEALGKENVVSLYLPSRYSSEESQQDAASIAAKLGITLTEISIETPFEAFLNLLSPYFEGKPHDFTEENLQARIRGMILMAFSNKHGYLALGTGNKSEMAMGYNTLYGDLLGALLVIGDVIKEHVYNLAHLINKQETIIPNRVIDKAPSAELRFGQKDSDSLPAYPFVDAVISHYVEGCHSPDKIASITAFEKPLVKQLVSKIHLNEYKRRQAPLVLRVTKKALTVGRRIPIVHQWERNGSTH